MSFNGRPVVIVSVGRSGSSVFYRVLAHHPHLAFITHIGNRYPHNPRVNRMLLNGADLPLVGGLLRRKLWVEEGYEFWDRQFPGFSTPIRDLRAGDVTLSVKRRVLDVFAQQLTRRRQRLLLKVTGWPRIGFFKEIFEDARFIHIVRDGRAVASSLLDVHFWWGWRGPENWRFGNLSPEHRDEWERHDRSFVALACIQWKILMDAVEKASAGLDRKSFLQLRYEDFCADAVQSLHAVCDFCDLPWSSALDAAIRRDPVRSTNDKWKQTLTKKQIEIVEEVLGERVRQLGYT
jgi:hypothetical protein